MFEIHSFLDEMEKKKNLRVLAFTGGGEGVFIRHYEVGELADTAENNLKASSSKDHLSEQLSKPKELHLLWTDLQTAGRGWAPNPSQVHTPYF